MLGLDLDEAAEAVLGMFFRVIPRPRPRVAIVHAHDLPTSEWPTPACRRSEMAEEERRLSTDGDRELAQVVARARHAQKRAADRVPEFKTYVRFGDPRSVLKAAARQLDTDLLVLGTHGHSGISQVFLGTVAGDILRDVRCDVLVVPPRRPAGRRG